MKLPPKHARDDITNLRRFSQLALRVWSVCALSMTLMLFFPVVCVSLFNTLPTGQHSSEQVDRTHATLVAPAAIRLIRDVANVPAWLRTLLAHTHHQHLSIALLIPWVLLLLGSSAVLIPPTRRFSWYLQWLGFMIREDANPPVPPPRVQSLDTVRSIV